MTVPEKSDVNVYPQLAKAVANEQVKSSLPPPSTASKSIMENVSPSNSATGNQEEPSHAVHVDDSPGPVDVYPHEYRVFTNLHDHEEEERRLAEERQKQATASAKQ